jgi:hypothetical protein
MKPPRKMYVYDYHGNEIKSYCMPEVYRQNHLKLKACYVLQHSELKKLERWILRLHEGNAYDVVTSKILKQIKKMKRKK